MTLYPGYGSWVLCNACDRGAGCGWLRETSRGHLVPSGPIWSPSINPKKGVFLGVGALVRGLNEGQSSRVFCDLYLTVFVWLRLRRGFTGCCRIYRVYLTVPCGNGVNITPLRYRTGSGPRSFTWRCFIPTSGNVTVITLGRYAPADASNILFRGQRHVLCKVPLVPFGPIYSLLPSPFIYSVL
jgi:hypothetical protein